MARVRTAPASRGGPGFIGLIIFIVLSVLLIGGYAGLVPAFVKRSGSLNQLHHDIKQNIEDKLKGTSAAVSAVPGATAADAMYDTAFFSKVADYALKGVKFDELAAKTGYAGADPAADIQKDLGSVVPPQETLRSWIQKLQSDLTFATERFNQANTARQAAETARDTAQRLEKEAEDRANKARDEAEKEKQAILARDKADLGKTKALLEQADKATKEARQELADLKEAHKKDLADLNEKIKSQGAQIEDLNNEIARKKPVEIPVLEGHILQVNNVEAIAIIDIGAKEHIQTGEKFTVMRVGRGGQRTVKGEIQVVRVDPLVSRADILKPNSDEPLLQGDVVVRQKHTEEAQEAPKEK